MPQLLKKKKWKFELRNEPIKYLAMKIDVNFSLNANNFYDEFCPHSYVIFSFVGTTLDRLWMNYKGGRENMV